MFRMEGGTAVYQQYIDPDHVADLDFFLHLIRSKPVGGISESHPQLDWDYIVKLARRHKVLPLLYASLRKRGLVEQLPAAVQDDLRAKYLRIAADNMRFEQRLIEIVVLLAEQGVPAVPFKGPVLARCLYGDPALRQYSDMDILVPADKVARAFEIIQPVGYRPKRLHLTKDQLKRFVNFTKSFDFLDDRGQVELDLHWRLSMHTGRVYNFEFCRERLTTVSFERGTLPCLSPEDMVVFLCVHGTSHNWANADTVLSVAEYIGQYPNLDWALIVKLADKLDCRRMVWLGLFLARDLFGVNLPVDITGQMEKEGVVDNLARQVYASLFEFHDADSHFQKRLREVPFQLMARDSWPARLYYIQWRLFWPTQKDWEALPLPAGLWFLYFVLRPVMLGLEVLGLRGNGIRVLRF